MSYLVKMTLLYLALVAAVFVTLFSFAQAHNSLYNLEEAVKPEPHNPIDKTIFEGHEYLYTSGGASGRINHFIHSPSCSCHTKPPVLRADPFPRP